MAELNGKRLELLCEFITDNGPLAVVWDRPSDSARHVAEMAGRQRKCSLLPLEIKDAIDIELALKTAVDARADGVARDCLSTSLRPRCLGCGIGSKKPATADLPSRAFVDAGGLLNYGPSLIDNWRHAAIYVDRILKGERPTEPPVEQLNRLELVINLKAAKALNRIVPSLLFQATELSE